MSIATLNDLFLNELRDIYDAETRIIKSLPAMAEKASHSELQQAFEHHLEETKEQKKRLERAFDILGESPEGETCHATKGLIKEAENLLDELEDEEVCDAALIAAAQKIEHYEMATYGTLCAFALRLGHNEVHSLLQETLTEEKSADQKLNMIATSSVNRDAERKAA